MNSVMLVLEEFFGKAGGYVVGALLLSLLATGVLLAGRIDGGTWQVACLGFWGSVVGGGAVSAFRK